MDTDVRIGMFTAEFIDPDVEDAFARSNVEADARRLMTLLVFGGMIAPIFSIPDFIRTGATPNNFAVFAVQATLALVSIVLAIRLRHDADRARSHIGVTVLELIAMSSAVVMIYLRPEEITMVQVTFCVLVASIFMFIPNRMVYAVAIVTVGLLGLVVLSLVVPPPDERIDLKVVMGLLTVTVICGWAGYALARSRRLGFANLLHERWSNARLLEEISRRQALEEELTWLADHDTLTDVLNRRAFFEQAEQQMSVARRTGRPLSVLVIDADRFKSINDDFGHHTGDEAIRTIARLCKVNLRADDLVGRLGGEEFAVVMPAANLDVAEAVASRLREQIALHQIAHPHGPVMFTISVGVVECRPWSGASVQDAIQRADEAMYEAKAAGRNRVIAVPA